jgi:hypothetical protein
MWACVRILVCYMWYMWACVRILVCYMWYMWACVRILVGTHSPLSSQLAVILNIHSVNFVSKQRDVSYLELLTQAGLTLNTAASLSSCHWATSLYSLISWRMMQHFVTVGTSGGSHRSNSLRVVMMRRAFKIKMSQSPLLGFRALFVIPPQLHLLENTTFVICWLPVISVTSL